MSNPKYMANISNGNIVDEVTYQGVLLSILDGLWLHVEQVSV